MLTIKNIDKIRGFKIIIKGFTFLITEISVTGVLYTITLVEENGSAWAPIKITIHREVDEYGNRSDIKKYVMRYNNDKSVYIDTDELLTQYEFIKNLTNYVNNLPG